jgi:hypothetical protein
MPSMPDDLLVCGCPGVANKETDADFDILEHDEPSQPCQDCVASQRHCEGGRATLPCSGLLEDNKRDGLALLDAETVIRRNSGGNECLTKFNSLSSRALSLLSRAFE